MRRRNFLIQQLQEFGLNPLFWRMQKLKQKNTWLLIHKHSKELRLRGMSRGQKQWIDLEWLI